MTIQLFVWIFTICCYFQIVDFFVYVQMSNRRRWLSDSLIIFRVRYNAHPQFYLPVPTLIFLEVLNSRNDCWTRFWNATKMWDILNDSQDFYILTTMCLFRQPDADNCVTKFLFQISRNTCNIKIYPFQQNLWTNTHNEIYLPIVLNLVENTYMKW